MEYLAQILSQVTGDTGTFQAVFISTIAVAIFLLTMGCIYILGSIYSPLHRRLRLIAGQKDTMPTTGEKLSRALQPLVLDILPNKDWEHSKVRTRLVQAGFRTDNALTNFYVVKTMLAILLPGAVVLLGPMFPQFTISQVLIAALMAGLLGMFVPNTVLERLQMKRMQKLRNGFPDALDLLVVCSEAGLALNAAIERVGKELSLTYPELAGELSIINAEIRVGVNRVEALRNFANRTGLPDIRGLVALLTQSLRLGTGIAATLRIYAEEFRDKRMQLAEEQAAKIGTKMIFPLVTCLFPGFFAVIIGPAIIRIMAAFSQLG